MATLAPQGRIDDAVVAGEIDRLQGAWGPPDATDGGDDDALLATLPGLDVDALDLFDRAQLATVVRVVRSGDSLGAAGRRLFAASRARKRSSNDTDRLKKYLARFGRPGPRAGSAPDVHDLTPPSPECGPRRTTCRRRPATRYGSDRRRDGILHRVDVLPGGTACRNTLDVSAVR